MPISTPDRSSRKEVVMKVKKSRREKIVVINDKQLKETIGSSGYMVSWGIDGDPNQNPDSDGGR
jgi:hypothetical protein